MLRRAENLIVSEYRIIKKDKELINSPLSALPYLQKGNIIIGKSNPVIVFYTHERLVFPFCTTHAVRFRGMVCTEIGKS